MTRPIRITVMTIMLIVLGGSAMLTTRSGGWRCSSLDVTDLRRPRGLPNRRFRVEIIFTRICRPAQQRVRHRHGAG